MIKCLFVSIRWFEGFNWEGLKKGTLAPPIIPNVSINFLKRFILKTKTGVWPWSICSLSFSSLTHVFVLSIQCRFRLQSTPITLTIFLKTQTTRLRMTTLAGTTTFNVTKLASSKPWNSTLVCEVKGFRTRPGQDDRSLVTFYLKHLAEIVTKWWYRGFCGRNVAMVLQMEICYHVVSTDENFSHLPEMWKT